VKKPLPKLRIGAEAYERIEALARDLLAACRHEADNGATIFYPDTGGAYQAMWTRDFAYMVEYAGQLMDAGEILGGIDYLLGGQRDDGVIPDRVCSDGTPIYHAGPVKQPLGGEPPTDNAQFMVKAVFAYCKLTGDFKAFLERRETLYRGMESVPLSDDGLVFVDANRPHSAYGFTDTVAKTGKVLFSSLLYWEACQVLAEMLRQCEYHDEALEWYEAAEGAGKPLGQFYDDGFGMFRAASEDCNQIDLWGSAYACVNRAASKGQANRVADFFLAAWDQCFHKGHVRHLPGRETWQRLLLNIGPETYQNGAFWAVPTGWCAQTINLLNEGAAARLIRDCLAQWEAEGVYECIGPYTQPKAAGYVASATNMLGACRP